MSGIDGDWSKPAAMAIPKEGYFELERGRYGPVFPRTPACYGFSIIAKVKEGREDAIRELRQDDRSRRSPKQPGGTGTAAAALPAVGAVRCRAGLHFQYQGIFDTDFDKYTEDAVAVVQRRPASRRCSRISKAFPRIGRRTRRHSSSSCASTTCPSFLEYGEYPYVTADEIKKALRLKAAFSDMLDQMQ